MQTCFKMFDCVQYDIQLPVRAVLCTNVLMCCDYAVQTTGCSPGQTDTWSNGHVRSFHPRVPGVLFLVLVLVLFLILVLFLFLVLLFSLFLL